MQGEGSLKSGGYPRGQKAQVKGREGPREQRVPQRAEVSALEPQKVPWAHIKQNHRGFPSGPSHPLKGPSLSQLRQQTALGTPKCPNHARRLDHS